MIKNVLLLFHRKVLMDTGMSKNSVNILNHNEKNFTMICSYEYLIFIIFKKHILLLIIKRKCFANKNQSNVTFSTYFYHVSVKFQTKIVSMNSLETPFSG